MESKKKPVLTELQAQKKAEHYCAYQERSQQEVRNKLYDWGLYPTEVENIIAELISENYINEERFAKAFVSGKFKMNAWGKIKIEQALKMKGISGILLKEALNSIEMEEYLTCLNSVLEKKARSLREKDPYKRKMMLANYAYGRGYESNLIFDILNNKEL